MCPRGIYKSAKRGRPKGALNKKVTLCSIRHKFEMAPEYAVVVSSRGGIRNSDENVDVMEV